LKIYDLRARRWRIAGKGSILSHPAWAPDGSHVFYQEVGIHGMPIYSCDVHTGTVRMVKSFDRELDGPILSAHLVDVVRNDQLVVRYSRSFADIYAAHLELP
jgi:hypothetical protein